MPTGTSSSRAFQWLSLVAMIWLQSINGTNSDFPAYSSQLKQLLSLSQLQLNNLAFASDAGKLFGFLSGVAARHLPLWLVLIAGSILGLFGYGLQYLFLANHIPSLSYWQFFSLSVLAGNSICWINTVCYIVTINNFPSHRQLAIGLTTSYVGLSAKIYTDVVEAFFPSSPAKKAKAYLLLNSCVPLAVSIIAAPIVRDNINVGKCKRMNRGFVIIVVITVITGVYAVISSLGSVSSVLTPLIKVILILAFLLVTLVTPLGDFLELKWRMSRERRVRVLSVEEGVKQGEREGEGIHNAEEAEEEEVTVDGGYSKEEVGARLMLKRIDFWLYFIIYLFGATLGLVFLNNLGQVAESRGLSASSSLVSLSSAFGFFGRLVPSILDYCFSKSKYMVSRPASIAILMAPLSGAFFLLLNSTNIFLFIGTAIIGVCTGAITSMAVSTTTELFGSKNFGVNHNVVVANIPLGSFLFGYLAALIYRIKGNGDGRCMGVQCYRETFLLWGSLCFLGTLLALILYARTRKFYSQRL